MGHLLFSTCVAFICLIGYVQAFHSSPWPSSINDGFFLLLAFTGLTYSLITIKNYRLSFSSKEIVVIGLILVHTTLSAIYFENRSVWPYALVLSVSFLLFKNEVKYPTIRNSLIAGVWIAALVTAIIGIGQWLGVWHQFDGRFLWMLEVSPGARMIGNLGQPNVTGTLLVWGVICALVISAKIETKFDRIVSQQATYGLMSASIILMTIASVLTQSRTTTLGLFAASLLAWKFKSFYGKRAFWTTVAVFVFHVAGSVLLPYIRQFLFESELTAAYGGKGIVDYPRLNAYWIFIHSILEKPFFGYGIGGVISAFIQGVDAAPGMGAYFAQTHNLILEFFVWFGIPLGLVLASILFRFFYQSYKKIKSTNDVALFSMLLVVLIHSMLEFPLHYVYMLVPTAIFAANFSRSATVHSLNLSRMVMIGMVLIFGTMSVLMMSEYLRFEGDIRQARLELGITGRARPPSDATTMFLYELNGANVMIRTEASSGMSAAQLTLFETTTSQFPMRPLIEKNIKAATFNGQPDRALYWQDKYCAIYGLKACASIPPGSIQ
jgi:hypothetical protein